MIIRKAKKEDIQQIYKLFLQLCSEEDKAAKKTAKFLGDIRNRRNDFEKSVKKELLKELETPKSIYLVAEEEGLMGYCYVSYQKTKDAFFKSVVIGYLNSIVVDKKHRRKGIAKKLHEEAIKWFKKNKCSIVYLEVFQNNLAVETYEKWKYKKSTCKMWKKL